jgi:CheY-like chemotaxis protein
MSTQKRILVVSQDLMALQTRKLMLGAYFEVTAAGRALEAKMLLAEREFDLIVLCYTLSEDDCRKIIDASEPVRPHIKILFLTAPGYSEKNFAHPHLPSEEGPFALVRKAAEMLGYEFASKGRMVRATQPPLVVAA